MDNSIIFLLVGLFLGIVFTWMIFKYKFKLDYVDKSELDSLNEQNNNLKITNATQKNSIDSLIVEKNKLENYLKEQKIEIEKKSIEVMEINRKKDIKDLEFDTLNKSYTELKNISEGMITDQERVKIQFDVLTSKHIEIEVKYNEVNSVLGNYKEENKILNNTLKEKDNLILEYNKKISSLDELTKSLKEKLETQKIEIEETKKLFNTEFNNIANKILEEKSQKFIELNKNNIETILKPLGENISEFRKKVEDTYDKESKQRFSLEEKIKGLMELNQKISQEANNLTNALKGQSKKIGNWGEMILERILENSGLTKDREYFVQEFLKDIDGNIIKNETGNKMQPDIIISCPDNRKIIIDSKVSLNAYERYCNSDEKGAQEIALQEHIASVKKHIDDLSSKNYQKYSESLDFVLLFMPIEPAFLLILQKDQEIWSYAYSKKIVLISPTNLIAVLKLINDLWKREYQNRNAIEIANRGEKLYEKLVSFVVTLQDVGSHFEKAHSSYHLAIKQLSEGKGNLLSQAEKLKELGINPKKSLPAGLMGE